MTHDNDFQFRFGLRSMIIGLTVAGVGIGLLGKLYFSNFPVFYSVASFLVTVVPFVLAVATVIRLGFKTKKAALTVWGFGLLATPLIGMVFLFWLQSKAGSMDGFGLMTDRQVIQQIGQKGDSPAIWRELERRVKSGSLSQEDTDSAIEELVAFMKQRMPNGWDQPLTWQDDFVRAAREADAVSQPVLLEICDEYFGTTPKIAPIDASQGGRVHVRVDYGTPWDGDNHSGLEVSHLWTVRRVVVDGEEVEMERGDRFAQQWTGITVEDVSPESKELMAEVEIAYIESSKMIGINDEDLSPDRWPNAIKRWKTEVRIPLDGTEPAKPKRTFTSVTDPSRRPAGEVRIERLVAQQDEGGRQMVIVQLAFEQGMTVPLSFDVSVEFDDQKHMLGGSWVASYAENGTTGQMSGGSTFSSRGHRIDPIVKAADVVLIPNVEHLEKGLENSRQQGNQDINEIWSKPIVFRNVPMERLDLDIENPPAD